MVLNALQGAGGQVYLQRQADESPAAFLALVGKCLPKDIKVEAAGSLQITVVTGVPDREHY